MTDALRAIVANPKLLATISSEQLSDGEDSAIVKAMEIISDRGNVPTPHAIRELIKQLPDESSKDPLLKALQLCVDVPLNPDLDPEFIIQDAKETYNAKLLFKAFTEGLRDLRDCNSDEILSRFAENVDRLATTTRTETMRDTVKQTITDIVDIANGKKKAYWPTGDDRFDETVNLCQRLLIVVAAQKKIGKTRFIVDRMLRLYKHNRNISFIWYSFEMKPSELIICMLAWMTGFDTKYISGKERPEKEGDPVIDPADLEMMMKYEKHLLQLPIKFVEEKKTVDGMCRDLRRWVKGPTVVIIDNIGLIELMPGMSDTQNEDHISKRLQGIRDELNLCIIAIHHLSKESESRFNKDDLYRPRVTHVRGSSRIIDFANQLWLLHRPGHYKDLKAIHGDKWDQIKESFLCDVAINRDGPDGEVNFKHQLGRSWFKEID